MGIMVPHPPDRTVTPAPTDPVTLEDGTRFWVEPIDKATARDLIVANHYSRTWNTSFGTANFGVFDGAGDLAGALVFGNLMNPASYSSIADLSAESIVELNRMWIADHLGPNTETACLSRAMRWLRRETSVQLVQTFADGRLGCGTVYKAANFGYYGHSETMFFRHSETGEVLHGTPFSNTSDLRPMVARNLALVRGELEALTVRTYRYLYPLTRYARRRIIPRQRPYPAYAKGEAVVSDYIPPASQIARCQVASEIYGYRDEARELAAFMDATYDPHVIRDAIASAHANPWVVALREATQPDLFGLLGEASA